MRSLERFVFWVGGIVISVTILLPLGLLVWWTVSLDQRWKGGAAVAGIAVLVIIGWQWFRFVFVKLVEWARNKNAAD